MSSSVCTLCTKVKIRRAARVVTLFSFAIRARFSGKAAARDCVTRPVPRMPEDRSMQKPPIAKSLDSIVLGAEISHGNLTMVPLMRRTGDSDESAAGYILLDEAIQSGAVGITEVSGQGRVPELRVVNRGRAPVLIVDGEELVGAKQNRIVNLTILVAATSELTIPVSCVEAGRWRARSRTFTSAPRTQYAAGRARRMSQGTQ